MDEGEDEELAESDDLDSPELAQKDWDDLHNQEEQPTASDAEFVESDSLGHNDEADYQPSSDVPMSSSFTSSKSSSKSAPSLKSPGSVSSRPPTQTTN